MFLIVRQLDSGLLHSPRAPLCPGDFYNILSLDRLDLNTDSDLQRNLSINTIDTDIYRFHGIRSVSIVVNISETEVYPQAGKTKIMMSKLPGQGVLRVHYLAARLLVLV